jgi:hypothetical protein
LLLKYWLTWIARFLFSPAPSVVKSRKIGWFVSLRQKYYSQVSFILWLLLGDSRPRSGVAKGWVPVLPPGLIHRKGVGLEFFKTICTLSMHRAWKFL